MRSKLFSPLIRGHGPEWSADFKWYEDQPSKAPPHNDTGQHSRYVIHDRHLYRTVPKTFTTNKGAIVLYTSEDYVVKDKLSQAVHPASTKEFQTSDLDNLQRNILQFGTSEEDKTCLRFTRPNVDDVYLDESTRPGALPEVYLEDLKYKTRLLTKTNKMAVARLRPTERVKTARTQCPSPSLFAESPDSPSSSRPDSGAEKRRLLRPPSAPPQLMPSVEKRKVEIIRDQMKHLDAAQRRERMKYADFEFVSTIPDHLQVKGLGGKVPKRRAYSSPVYKTQYNEDKSYVTCDQTKSVPLFIVTSSPTYRRSLSRTEHPAPRGSHEFGSYCSEDSDRLDLTDSLHHQPHELEGFTKSDIIAAEIKPRVSQSEQEQRHSTISTPGSGVDSQLQGLGSAEGEQISELPDRCPSSRQIIIDLPDENKEKPKDSFISEELMMEMMDTHGDHGGKVVDDEATPTTSTIEQKSGEEISSAIDDSLQNITTNRILTYPSFLSLSSANSKGDTAQQDSEGSMDPEAKRDALLDAKNLINEISSSKKSRRKRGGKDSKEGDTKKKTVKSAKSKKEAETPIIPVSDGEYKEKQPPKSLVAMHKDNIDSSVSITKKKGSQSGSKKRRSAKCSDRVAWDTDARSEGANSETEDVFSQPPQTMLLDSDNEEQSGSPQRKRTDRSLRQRSDQTLDKTAPNTPSTSAELSKTADMSGSLTKDRSHDLEEGEEDMEERMRQEEREKELKTLELLERRIGIEDGSLKRLGEKVEIIEKETNQQKDKEAALRQQEIEEESARKEEERRAYEEVMRAQEAEYEKHLQNMLRQEEERNKQYLDSLRKEEIQRDIKRKLAMFRQHQNLELRQHVRLSKLKQKITVPFKYSYFPILKVNYMKIVMNPEQSLRKSSGGNNKNVKKKKMTLKRV
ncbi:putative autophagy-related protein 11 [Bolinopsis microptera]|uniref:putative autophagy-related protein 11 n=1 Tax=Bolinopsis microptera TaxID=2820187 RepID=UPI003079C69B